MKIYLIRHGEPDYGPVTNAGYTGFGRDLSPLTKQGVLQAQHCAEQPIFNEVQLILASPYTRALQTATEIIRRHNRPLQVELGLHEWYPDKSGWQIKSGHQAMAAYDEYTANHGQANETQTWDYETSADIRHRVQAVFDKYQHYQCVACVTHSEVMRQFGDWRRIGYCEVKMIQQ